MARRMSSQRSARADGWVRSGTGAMRRGARSWTALGTAAIRRPCEASARGRPATRPSRWAGARSARAPFPFHPMGVRPALEGETILSGMSDARAPQSAAAPSPFTPDRRLRVPLELPHRRARRARRGDRLAVYSALRLAECVRQPPGSRCRRLQARPVRHPPRHSARLRAGDERPRDDVAHADRLGTRPHCPHDGPAVA